VRAALVEGRVASVEKGASTRACCVSAGCDRWNAILVRDEWRAKASSTFTIAKDLTTDETLPQWPTDKANLSLIYDGFPKLEAETRLTLISSRYDYGTVSTVRLAPTPSSTSSPIIKPATI
jgi:hypothetical protein